MQYLIRARPRSQLLLPRFWALLNDGTIEKQEPDGREIIASMKRAVVRGDMVEWSETCYCTPALKHERETIYDRFFTEMEIEPIGEPTTIKGKPFWDYLQGQSRTDGEGDAKITITSPVRYVPIRAV
jgi:hypothetical protein